MTSFIISGVVPIILHATIIQLTPTTFEIHEVSNSRLGYQTRVYSDVLPGGYITFTDQGEQTHSINTEKILVLPKVPTYVQAVMIDGN